MNDFRPIKNRIWKYRNARGIKQADLAFLIGHNDETQVSRYETGRVMPGMEQLFKLCFALGIEIEALYPELVEQWRQEVDQKCRQKKIKIS